VVNGIDLDSMLAAWVLMNHAELARDAMRLLRLEGMIDAHGLNAGILSGFPPDIREPQEARIRQLTASARSASVRGADQLSIVVGMLENIDSLLLPEACLMELADYREIGRAPLAGGKVAIVCASSKGIYEAEESHKSRYGSTLGVLALHRGDSHYSMRLVAGFYQTDIAELYRYLNRIDPAASRRQGPENLWGGSSDLGGSPRLTGTGLTPQQILRAVQAVYGDGGSAFGRWLHRLFMS
jgi:hypothetical protein